MRIRYLTIVLLLLLTAGAWAGDDKKRSLSSSELNWLVAELSHPDLARREAATQRLIDAGESAVRKIRSLCDSRDEGAALRARRIFGAVHGVSPEVYDAVRAILWQPGGSSFEIGAKAKKIVEAGPGAAALALRLLDNKGELSTEIAVRTSLNRIATGADRQDSGFSTILNFSAAASPALRNVMKDRECERIVRTHALWLYSLVTGADRASGLAPLLSDSDPVIRHEAALATAETISAGQFSWVARGLGVHPGAERNIVANAAASRLQVKDLEKHLSSSSESAAVLAAQVLGFKRGEEALDTLTARIAKERRAPVLEAIASGLAEFRDPKGIEALITIYSSNISSSKHARVRSAAVSALRHQTSEREARGCITAALLDTDEGVRLMAADSLASLSDRAAAPALIFVALNDSSDMVQARALSGLKALVPDGPPATISGANVLDKLAESWRRWLDRNEESFGKEELPWFSDSRDATRIVSNIRESIESSFFYFEKKELVDTDALNKAAIAAMREVFEGTDPVKMEGTDRKIIEAVLNSKSVHNPETVLSCLGTIPFEAATSDLIRITNSSANGMLESLGDRYSRLNLSNDPEGKVKPGWLPGLLDNSDKSNGIYITLKDDVWVVDFILYDSSGFYAGIRVGDQLVKVGDKFTGELTRKEVARKVNKAGEFQFLREGWNRPYTFTLEPTEVMARRMVTRAVLPGKIGYIRLKSFDIGCSVKIEQALQEMERDGIFGLILDLRNNPGGTVIDATAIVDKFLPEGKTICVNVTRGGDDGHEEEEDELLSTDSTTDRDYPVVVLVNRSSASASEMTSGSLQGNERAVVVGETTFGKGIGQNGRTFAGFSSDTAIGKTRSVYVVYLTMMRYLLPEGNRSIHHIGVEPDVPVIERSLKGSAFDKVMKAQNSKAMKAYLADLLENHREIAIALAIFDNDDSTRYPGFDALHGKVKRWVSEKETRRIIRREIRASLIEEADDALFSKLFYDIQEDRTLRAGIRELAAEASVDLDGIEEYGKL